VHISFEPADLVDQIMSLGTNTPIEVAIQGRNLVRTGVWEKLMSELKSSH